MINVGIIGYGYWGPFIARNVNNIEGLRLHSICDRRQEARTKAASLYQDAKITADSSELLGDPGIDAVAVITPVSTHYDLARQALENGKHVFVEKPFTQTSAQAKELIELAEARRKTIMVDHTFLFTGAVNKMKEILDSDTLGKPFYYDSVRINLGLFQHDVNVIWDLAPHDLSIMDYLLGGMKPLSLCAHGSCHFNRDLEDVAYMCLHFEDNLIAHFHLNWLSPTKIRQTIIGCEKKMLLWDDMDTENKIKIYEKGVEVDSPEGVYDMLYSYRWGDMWAPRIPTTEALSLELSYFRDCLESGEKPHNDGQSGLRVVEILEASSRSLAEGERTIEF
ncbi:MAG: Gfo/Idh/MocA family oxidoreductase [Gemmatimonadota bacterium]|nr:Gfo/Idh/MocA family oxidoreductase [Gemmatimonadota bacterium]